MNINWKLFRKFVFGFIFIILTSFIVSYLVKPSLNDFLSLTDNIGDLGIPASRTAKFFQYFINNGIKVPFQMLILSFIPIPLLYFSPMFLTAIVTGIVLYIPFMAEAAGKMTLVDILAGLLPHMVIEFFGFLIIVSSVYYVNQAIRSQLFKKISSEFSITESLKELLKIYFLFALPCLVIAAAIEAYITPLISSIMS